VIQTAGRISKGASQPRETRRAATVAGISCMDAVFSTIRRHNSSEAVLPGMLPASLFAASIPRGVAAFPSPRKFAQTFPLSLPAKIGLLFAEGKMRYRIGDSVFDKNLVIPLRSITFPIPDHKQIEPAIEMARVTPV